MKHCAIGTILVMTLLLPAAEVGAQAAGNYLPLATGMKWVLRSPAMKDPVVLEVLAQNGAEYRLRFDNPWLKSEMTLLARGGKYYVTSVAMGGQAVPMPRDTLYFDLTAREGTTWQNAIGTLAVTSRRKTVRVGRATHQNSIQIRETTKDGNQLYWTFASSVGFVQFGEGTGAFVLDPSASSLQPAAVPRASASSSARQPGATYLPVRQGARWTLRSPASKEPIVLEILEHRGNEFLLRFDNPWLDSTMGFVQRDGKYFVTSVDMGAGRAPMPADTLYFDFTSPQGTTWRNRIGALTILSRGKTVATPSGTYNDAIQIREVTAEGRELLWTFAPGVGFVQFGEGRNAFVLERDGSSNARAPRGVEPSAFGAFAQPPVEIALAANPSANEPYNERTVMSRYRQSLAAGVTYQYLSPKWDELERSRGAYDWKDIDFQVKQAIDAGLPVVCNLRIIDTGNRAMPADLKNLPFDHPEVRKRLRTLLDGLLPRLKDRAQLLLLGNEVDAYFRGRRDEVAAYAALFQEARQTIRQKRSGTPVSVSMTLDGLNDAGGLLKPMLDGTDFFAITYYPLNPDFTFRDPRGVASDFARIVAAAGPKKVLFQEIGYSTSPLNNSSEDQQAAFYREVFANLRRHRSAVLGASFLFMSDFSDAQVEAFAAYYKLPGVERFKAFLATLGLFDRHGRPKKAWDVFREEASSLKHATTP